MAGRTDLYTHSSLREGMLEHLFVGDVMKTLWKRGFRNFEVLRPVTDAAGYDVVLSASGVVRHVQLKSSSHDAKTSRQNVNIALSRHQSGCVVWMRFCPDTLEFSSFSWFGALAGQPLPALGTNIARHAKANASGEKTQRANIRTLAKGQFENGLHLEEIVDRLFGVQGRQGDR